MVIYAADQGFGKPRVYRCDRVDTWVGGRLVHVGVDYEGPSRMHVIRQIIYNADFKRQRMALVAKMRVSR